MNEDHQTLKVPRTAVRQLEVSWGRKSRWWQGMLVGAAVGAGIGLAEGPNCDSYGCYTRAQNATYGSLAMAGLGALIGKAVKSDRWMGISLLAGSAPAARSKAAPVGAQAGTARMGVSMSLSFD